MTIQTSQRKLTGMKPKPPPTEFARAVREAREREDISQAELAARLGVTVSTVYRIERGFTPSVPVEVALRRWCRTLPAVNASQAA